MTKISLQEAADRIGRMVREHPLKTAEIMRDHGAGIVARAAVLTPVDTGYLVHRDEYEVEVGPTAVSLVIRNPTVYAHYQHTRVMRHTKPTARDHFISIPFEAGLPAIVTDIIDADMEAFE